MSVFIIAAVDGVTVRALCDSVAQVSWSAIRDFSIDYYTVVYSQVSRHTRQNGGEMSALFLSQSTSGLVAGLDSTSIYQFQVFATATVGGREVSGERSSPVSFTISKS